MSDQDLPNQSPDLQALNSDIRADIANMGRNNLFFLSKAILGYKDLTEQCHGPLCVFHDDNTSQFKLALMPRDHLKTTCITIAGSIKRAIKDPNRRILIANESATNAQRMLRSIKQQAENNVLFRTLYSSIIPKNTRKEGLRWNDNELDFVRSVIVPEPTFDTVGMTGAFTSRHYTDIIADDLISEEAINSESVMKETIERSKGLLSLLTEPVSDPIFFVGTHWARWDLYTWIKETYAERLAIYAASAYDLRGEPIWPERMPKELLEFKRKVLGEYRFSCLYLNRPRGDVQDGFNVDLLNQWSWADAGHTTIRTHNADGTTSVYSLDSLDITVTVDLAIAEKKTDDMNSITTVGTTTSGKMIILDAWGERCPPGKVIDYMFKLKQRYSPRVFGIEAVAYQKSLKYFVKEEAERRGTYLNVKDISAIGKKNVRIRGLQPILNVGRMFYSFTNPIVRNQFSEFPLGKHDDVIDSISMHLQLMQGQLSEFTISKRQEQIESAVNSIMLLDDPYLFPPLSTTETTHTFILS